MQLLQAEGLQLHARCWVKSGAPEPAPRVQTELTVLAVDRSNAGTFSETVHAGFGMPAILKPWLEALPSRDGWYCFLAMAGDEPAGAAAIRIAGGIGWIGLGATRPEHRRKGAQSALLAARIAAGLELGVEGFTTETGRPHGASQGQALPISSGPASRSPMIA